jgi:hypothetical protein
LQARILAKLSHKAHVQTELLSRQFRRLGKEEVCESWAHVSALSFNDDMQNAHFGGNLLAMVWSLDLFLLDYCYFFHLKSLFCYENPFKLSKKSFQKIKTPQFRTKFV